MIYDKQHRWLEEQHTLKRPIVFCSISRLDICINRGMSDEGSFIIKNVSESYLKGEVSSLLPALQLDIKAFEGNYIRVNYKLEATKLNAQNQKKSHIHIISNGGEIKIPVAIRIAPYYFDSSIGPIKDLYQFTDLARLNWQEATKIFRDPSFYHLLKGKQALEKVVALLRESTSADQALEEFLVYLHRKQSPQVYFVEEHKSYEGKTGPIEDHVKLSCDGWGWIEGTIETDLPNLRLHIEKFHHQMFKQGQLIIKYTLLPEASQASQNTGHIYVTTRKQQLTLKITLGHNYEAKAKITNQQKRSLNRDEIGRTMKLPSYLSYKLWSSAIKGFDQLSLRNLKTYLTKGNLSTEEKIALYTYLIKYKKELYLAYQERIHSFINNQLKEKNLSFSLVQLWVLLYQESQPIDQKVDLPLLFYWKITCLNAEMVKVVVAHEELEAFVEAPLINGRALIPLYTDNYEIMVVDKKGYGYLYGVSYTLKKLIPKPAFKGLWQKGIRARELSLYLSQKAFKYGHMEGVIDIYESAVAKGWLSRAYRSELLLLCINYYFEHNETEDLIRCLSRIDLEVVSTKDRVHLIEHMILMGLSEEAIKAISEYGYELIGIKKIYRLCHQLLGKTQEPLLDELCFYVFDRRKHDEKILCYTMENYKDNLEDMLELWSEGKRVGLISEKLEERILDRILYTGTYLQKSLDVFKSYYFSHQGSLLVEAFVHYLFFQYVVHDFSIPDYLFQILQEKSMDDPLKGTLEYALLKHLSQKQTKTPQEIQWIETQLEICMTEERLLPWFDQFEPQVKLPENIKDKGYILYTTEPKYEVICHYRLEHEVEFRQRQMRYIGCGMFMSEFYMFYGEEIQYYIEEKRGNKGHITHSAIYCHEVINWEDDQRTKTHLINTMRMAQLVQDDRSLEEAITEYLLLDQQIKNKFTRL